MNKPQLIVNGVDLTEYSEYVSKVMSFVIGRGLEEFENMVMECSVDNKEVIIRRFRKFYMDIVNDAKRNIISYFMSGNVKVK